jgi:hypothetical protein
MVANTQAKKFEVAKSWIGSNEQGFFRLKELSSGDGLVYAGDSGDKIHYFDLETAKPC